MIAQHYICIANIDVDDDCDCECCDGYDNQIIYIYQWEQQRQQY